MRIWDSIRGHFALMEGQTFYTLAQHKPFTIESVVPKKEGDPDWFIYLRVGKGTRQRIYLTDMIKVYFRILRQGGWITLEQIKATIDIGKGQSSYLMMLLTTFDDIEANEKGTAIRYVD